MSVDGEPRPMGGSLVEVREHIQDARVDQLAGVLAVDEVYVVPFWLVLGQIGHHVRSHLQVGSEPGDILGRGKPVVFSDEQCQRAGADLGQIVVGRLGLAVSDLVAQEAVVEVSETAT